MLEWLHAVRAFFPQVVLLLACAYLSVSRRPSAQPLLPTSLKLWLAFGLVGLVACVLSPSPLNAAYWSLAYLGGIVGIAAYLSSGDPLRRATELNYLSWFLTTVFLLTMVVLAREALFANPQSGYAVLSRQRQILDMSMSRSTGLARFAAVPGIVGLGYSLCRRGAHRVLGGLVFAGSFGAFIYYLQARGSIFGFAGAVVVVMLLAGVRGRALLAGLVLTALCAWVAEVIPASVWAHATRGETGWAELRDLTGRVNTWQEGWDVFLTSPVIGFGPRADRLLGLGEIHNTWMSALLQSGVVGGLALLAGLFRAWADAYRAARYATAERLGQRMLLAQTGGILAFFTLRGLVEQSGSLFNVDLLVMLPAMAYVGVLGVCRRGRRLSLLPGGQEGRHRHDEVAS